MLDHYDWWASDREKHFRLDSWLVATAMTEGTITNYYADLALDIWALQNHTRPGDTWYWGLRNQGCGTTLLRVDDPAFTDSADYQLRHTMDAHNTHVWRFTIHEVKGSRVWATAEPECIKRPD